MPDRNLTLLAGITFMVLAAAWVAVNNRYATVESVELEGGLVFPELNSVVNTVDEIEVARPGGSFTLKRDSDRWVNSSVGDFPIPLDRVEKIILSIAALKYLEPKTTRKELYHKLDVEDVEADSKSTRLLLKNATGAVIADVIVGKPKSTASIPGLYVRIAGNRQAWLVGGVLDVRYDAVDWLDRLIIDIDSDVIMELVVRHLDGEVVNLGRDNNSLMIPINLPAGVKVQHQYQIDFLAGLLESAIFNDAKPGNEDGLTIPSAFEATVITNDYLEILVSASAPEEDGSVWAHFKAAISNEILATNAAREQQRNLNTKLSHWQFRLPRKFTDRLKIRLSDITGIPATNNQ